MTESGHMIAQLPQPMHLSISNTAAGWKPLMLIFDVSILTIFTGQLVVHNPQPLQMSSLNVTLPLATLTPPKS